MESKWKMAIFIWFGILLCGCEKDYNNVQNYYQYLNDSDNGLSHEKTVQGVAIKIKYLPVDYMVLNELKNHNNTITEVDVKKIKNEYENSLNFLMTISPAKNEKFDVTKVGVKNYKEFNERIMTMSFGMQEMISIKVEEEFIYPKIAQLERIFGLEKSRHINIAFERKIENGEDILKRDFQFVFQDRIFQTGINKFLFREKDIKKIPPINHIKMINQNKH